MVTFALALFGLIFGSFANAVVWRLHEQEQRAESREQEAESSKQKAKKTNHGQRATGHGLRATGDGRPTGGAQHSALSTQQLSISRGRSMCPDCKHELAPQDLVPVLSWLALRGRCRYCKKPISPQYPLVELATAALFAVSYLIFRPAGAFGWLHFAIWLYLIVSLIILAVYDLRWMILPDRVLVPAIVVAAVGLILELVGGAPDMVWVGPLAAALVVGGGFYGLAWISRGRWLGGGDIKLSFLMGLMLGLQNTTLAMLLAFNLAALVGIILIAAHRKTRKDYLPFGPFLIIGTLVAAFYGQAIIAAYLRVGGY